MPNLLVFPEKITKHPTLSVNRNEDVKTIDNTAPLLRRIRRHISFLSCGILLGLWFASPIAHAQEGLVISEFLAINSNTIQDDFGQSSDYVEIYNGTPGTINLGGYYLTDSLADKTQWQFPATNLDSGHHLLIWASGQDRRIPGAPLHTNFKLDGNGEALALVQPDRVTVVHQYLFGQQILD